MELFKIINYNNLFFNEKFYDFLKTMQPVSIAQIKKQANIVNFSKHDKENFIKTCNILVKNPQQDNIYFDLTHYEFNNNFQDYQNIIVGLRPEYVSNTEQK